MVIYDLECHLDHRFEGWFPNENVFKGQLNQWLITCTHCGSNQIRKLPSISHLRTTNLYKPSKAVSHEGPQLKTQGGDSVPAINYDPVIFLKAMHQYIKKNLKDVGPDFSEQAIKMAKGEQPSEGIHGTATHEDCDRLEDEGVDYSLLPNFLRRLKIRTDPVKQSYEK